MTRVAAQPALYDIATSPPALRGTRCAACGDLAFPPLRWGCERCGATEDHLTAVLLPAEGELWTSATVHFDKQHRTPVPFAVVDVVLDAGPVVRGLLAAPTDEGLRPGDRMTARWCVDHVDDDGHEVVEPRFAKAGPAAGEA